MSVKSKWQRRKGRRLKSLLFCCCILISTFPSFAGQPENEKPVAEPLLGDLNDGSRARPVHAIELRDAGGEVIRPTDRPLLPFSTVQTCGADCHDVEEISRGWHFTAALTGVDGGRRGQPWILVDEETATQLPLSYHAWPGCYHPEDVGITPWEFARLFGGRTPGGISGELEQDPQLRTRWIVSGGLEVNCLSCHDNSPGYDHAEYGRQIALENFRWAAAAASGVALITGAAKDMPNSYDYLRPYVEDSLLPRMPAVSYMPERFLPRAKLVFDIVREVPARRCYFCHSNTDLDHIGEDRWKSDEDIHLARGMSCVDCHRNGLDHSMIRGYEDKPEAENSEEVALSCRGCHLANEEERNFARGRLGAPYPRHTGIPPVHFTKLTCTACHSGPRPEADTRRLKTSQAHKIGGHNGIKAKEALPHLYYPVYDSREAGQTAPNRLLWPAFWGCLSEEGVRPIAPERLKSLMAKANLKLSLSPDGSWPGFDNALLTEILGLLQAETQSGETAVYISGGKLHRLENSNIIMEEGHQSAQPYLWPLAHDVRPASLSLGAAGCEDCHDSEAPIFFGNVTVDSPLVEETRAPWKMHRFQEELNTAYADDFARSFRYRPWLKRGAIASAALLALFVLTYFMRGIERLSAATVGKKLKRISVNLIGLVSCAAIAASGFNSLLSGQKLTGYWLIIHVAAAPVFAVCAVLVTLFWAHRNRLSHTDWNRLRRPIGSAEPGVSNGYVVVLRKLFFWIAAAAAIPAVVSVTLAMFPVLASVRQEDLILVHRFSVIPLAVSSLFFALLAFAAWIGKGTE
ncbi:MAG: hypothetical protein JXR49_16385 [Acidobacteria bacterium]|nr:hypothetical protein [Acidobacteriota bacterium]